MSEPALSIVVPAYNEEESLIPFLEEVEKAVDIGPETELLIVDDGSSDNTRKIALTFAGSRPGWRILAHKTNQGSCRAILTGIKAAQGRKIIYLPADGQFDPTEIALFLEASLDYDLVLGVRDSRYDYSLYRRLNSSVYLFLSRLFFGLSYPDLNWVHLWDGKMLKEVEPLSRSIFFLQEIVLRAQKAGYSIGQVPSHYRARSAGCACGGKPRVVLDTFRDMLCFAWKYRSL